MTARLSTQERQVKVDGISRGARSPAFVSSSSRVVSAGLAEISGHVPRRLRSDLIPPVLMTGLAWNKIKSKLRRIKNSL